MEDKTFELLEKMYNEFSEFKKNMNDFHKETKEDIQGLKNDVLRFENEHGRKLEALFDGYKQTHEKIEDIGNKVEILSGKVERQDN